MREIRFRGIDADTAEWHYGDIAHHDGIVSHICQHPADGSMRVMQLRPETIGQYTGLKDRKGKEIFEGDIVWWRDMEPFGSVFFDDGAFKVSSPDSDSWELLIDKLIGVEVIGNIHDNPELMEGADV